jgi:magnesium transporter
VSGPQAPPPPAPAPPGATPAPRSATLPPGPSPQRPRRRRSRSFERTGRAIHAALAPGPETTVAATVNVIAYGPDGIVERQDVPVGELKALVETWPVTWVDVAGLSSPETIQALGAAFGLHQLALEDVVHVHQRPKLDPYPQHIYLVLRMADYPDRLETEQLSVFLGPKWVITFQEDRPGDCFGLVRDRLRKGLGPLRASGPDQLLYAIVDSVIDSQFPVLEAIGEKLEAMELRILENPSTAIAGEIQEAKRDLLVMRRVSWPTRDALAALYRDPTPLVGDEARLLLRDAHDHAIQIMDLVETFREVASGLMELYLSAVSNRMNEIMKVLTIIATIFMPLSFIAGVYGMNFSPSESPWDMPELHWRYGYPFALGLMVFVAVVLLGWFWHKGWLTDRHRVVKKG